MIKKRRIIVIGTLHAGLTPIHELLEILEEYLPDQLLLEIADSDLISGKINGYPIEMLEAYNWAKQHGLNTRGFDSKINTLKNSLTEKDNQRAIDEQKKIIGKLSWKKFNKAENLKKLEVTDWLTDPNKEKQRTKEMLSNLKLLMISRGTILILTGCSHLKAIKTRYPEAEFPLANY